MLKKTLRFSSWKLIHFSVVAAIYSVNPVHAGHLHKLLPSSQLKKIHHQYDRETSERFNSWQRLMQQSQDKTPLQKLQLVNHFFNQMKWVEDKELWQQRDYWATPIESLIRNAGDCEDFSIAKYFTLLELGIPVSQLKVSYVKLAKNNQAHMVLAYYPVDGTDPLILDNTQDQILLASQRSDLMPMFHFNDEGVWSEEQPGTRLDSAYKIRQWADLMQRMQQEQS